MSDESLVVEAQSGVSWSTGLGLVEDAVEVSNSIHDHSWVDAALGGVGGSLDALAKTIDPLGSLLAWGVGWLLEHVKPLKDALDWLAGNPAEISAHAGTWSNVAAATNETRQQYAAAVQSQMSAWQGASGDAYRRHAAGQLAVIEGVAVATEAISHAVEAAGMLVSLVREIVRDLIAQFVATLAVRLPQWLAAEGLTLGLATPVVVSQVASLVAIWVNKIQQFVRALLGSLRRLMSKLDDLTGVLARLGQQLQRSGRTDFATANTAKAGYRPGSGRQAGGEVRSPRNAMDFEERWADEAYDAIRASDDEVPTIAETVREHGFSTDDIVRIKDHIFREEHLLDSYSGGQMARFDASPRIAEAWHRLSAGQAHPADLDLLRHERYEAEFMAGTGDPSYRRAHAATLEAGFEWDPEAAAADGLGYQNRG